MERAGEGEGQEVYGLLNDIMFKHVLADERDLSLLSLMVNGLLGTGDGERIEMAALRTPMVEREYFNDRCAIFDLSARDTKNRSILWRCSGRFIDPSGSGTAVWKSFPAHWQRRRDLRW